MHPASLTTNHNLWFPLWESWEFSLQRFLAASYRGAFHWMVHPENHENFPAEVSLSFYKGGGHQMVHPIVLPYRTLTIRPSLKLLINAVPIRMITHTGCFHFFCHSLLLLCCKCGLKVSPVRNRDCARLDFSIGRLQNTWYWLSTKSLRVCLWWYKSRHAGIIETLKETVDEWAKTLLTEERAKVYLDPTPNGKSRPFP